MTDKTVTSELKHGDIVCAWMGSSPKHARIEERFTGPSHVFPQREVYVVRDGSFPYEVGYWNEYFGPVIKMASTGDPNGK